MKKIFGVFRYEYKMSIQRVGVWVVVLLLTGFFVYLSVGSGEMILESGKDLLPQAAEFVFSLNLFFPVVAGIVAADRAVRDRDLGVRELLLATGIPNITYVMGKYLGVAFSLLTLALGITVPFSVFLVFYSNLPIIFMLYMIWATMIIIGPAIFFITAFSLACPLIMPTRLYQILFTGYWYWGNFISPMVMFTISDTILNASGRYALVALFNTKFATNWGDVPVSQALLNILVLFACAALALGGMLWILRITEKDGGH